MISFLIEKRSIGLTREPLASQRCYQVTVEVGLRTLPTDESESSEGWLTQYDIIWYHISTMENLA